VTDKKFLGGAGVGFIGGAIAGAGITHMVHKNKQKKEEKEEKLRKKEKKDKKKKKKKRRGSSSSFSSCSSCSSSDSDSDSGRYSVGTKVWRNDEGYEYRGKIVSFDSRNNRYYIVWEDGDESEWSEKKVRRNRKKKSGSKRNSARYSIGTKVWTNWAGWEYSGTIVGVNSRYNTYHIVWEDGDESEWSEKKVRRSRMKRGLE